MNLHAIRDQFKRNGSFGCEAGDFHLDIIRPQAQRQLPHDGGCATNLQICNKQQDSPSHAQEITREAARCKCERSGISCTNDTFQA